MLSHQLLKRLTFNYVPFILRLRDLHSSETADYCKVARALLEKPRILHVLEARKSFKCLSPGSLVERSVSLQATERISELVCFEVFQVLAKLRLGVMVPLKQR